MSAKIKVVILAGGSGSRLWPLSRSSYPKQFLPVAQKETMLQATVKRLQGIEVDEIITICNEEHRFFVAEQFRQIGKKSKIILEPVGKNTAPAIALAAMTLIEKDVNLLILPADHVIKDEKAFQVAIEKASQEKLSRKLITFGIVPDQPHTGYGYIKSGKLMDGKSAYEIDSFIEKPKKDAAEKYIKTDEYFWNSGMFMFNASNYLNELKHFQPEVFDSCTRATSNIVVDLDFLRIQDDEFKKCPNISVDYAVLEKTTNAIVIPMNAGWSDVGSWSSLWDISEKNLDGNFINGDVIAHKTKNSYINSYDNLVTTVGVDNLIIVSTKDSVMVASKENVDEIKEITLMLKDQSRSECDVNREVFRPWGKYDSVDIGDGFQVKRITVNPHSKLSLQMHNHRSEHWVVVSGEARVTNGSEVFTLKKNHSTYIPVGETHSLENSGNVPLEIIEIQTGSYLGEDDIVRFDDRYGRVKG